MAMAYLARYSDQLAKDKFEFHEQLVDIKYGSIETSYMENNLNTELNDALVVKIKELLMNIKSSTNINYCIKNIGNITIDKESKLILNGYKSISQFEKINKSEEVIGLDPKNQIIHELHNFIHEQFITFFKSPITIVNSKAWVSSPNSPRLGAHSPHTDELMKGNYKIMVYPYGLSMERGSLNIEGKLITDKPPGFAIAFNPNLIHNSVPGKSMPRMAIEISVMRTLTKSPQKNKSHPEGRHLYDPLLAY
tara:strand:- start:1679 stop:2428 length:750 start_codon:yes stop_codon:yes gene_type:complete